MVLEAIILNSERKEIVGEEKKEETVPLVPVKRFKEKEFDEKV